MTEPTNIIELRRYVEQRHPEHRKDRIAIRPEVMDALLARSERLERAVELLRVDYCDDWAQHCDDVAALLAEHDRAAKEAT